MNEPDPADWPLFVCLILTDARGRYVLERRPSTARAAPGKLTCFGGSREPGERPEAALDRELREELCLSCAAAGADCSSVVLVLVRQATPRIPPHPPHPPIPPQPPTPIAWFYRGHLPTGVEPVCRIPGHEVVFIDPDQLLDAELAPWHRAALTAFRNGQAVANVP